MGCRTPVLPPGASDPLPPRFVDRVAVFADLFTRLTWSHALVLLAGAMLAPGRRAVTAVLRILGREHDGDFCTFHRILNRAAWSSASGRRARGFLRRDDWRYRQLLAVTAKDGKP